jgi:hypothetical protein
MMCALYMSNYYLYDFLKIIHNEKIEIRDKTDDDLYIQHFKRYIIRTYSELGK